MSKIELIIQNKTKSNFVLYPLLHFIVDEVGHDIVNRLKHGSRSNKVDRFRTQRSALIGIEKIETN